MNARVATRPALQLVPTEPWDEALAWDDRIQRLDHRRQSGLALVVEGGAA
jgi:hypothetical protein